MIDDHNLRTINQAMGKIIIGYRAIKKKQSEKLLQGLHFVLFTFKCEQSIIQNFQFKSWYSFRFKKKSFIAWLFSIQLFRLRKVFEF